MTLILNIAHKLDILFEGEFVCSVLDSGDVNEQQKFILLLFLPPHTSLWGELAQLSARH